MKGCGKSLLTFVLGMITGVIVFFGAIFGTIAVIVSSVKIGNITDKVENESVREATSGVSDLSLLELFNSLKDTVSDKDNFTMGTLKEKYGVDILTILEKQTGLTISDNDVLVKKADVDAYVSGETTRISVYTAILNSSSEGEFEVNSDRIEATVAGAPIVFYDDDEYKIEGGRMKQKDSEGNYAVTDTVVCKIEGGILYRFNNPSDNESDGAWAETKTDALPIGNYYRVKEDGANKVFQILDIPAEGGEGTWVDCTTRYDIVNDEYVQNNDGAYYRVRGGVASEIYAAKLSNFNLILNGLLNSLTLYSVTDLVNGITLPDIGLINDYASLPITQALQSIMDLVDDIDNKTLGELQELAGISFGGGVFDVLADYKINQLANAIQDITIGDIMMDADRDLYVKYSEMAVSTVSISSYTNTINTSDLSAICLTVKQSETLGEEASYKIVGGEFYENVGTSESPIWETRSKRYNLTYTYVADSAGKYVLNSSNVYVLFDSENSEHTSLQRYKMSTDIVEDAEGEYVLIHEGSGIIGALAGASLNSLQDSIGNITLGDVIEINETSTALLKKLKDCSVNELSAQIDTLTIEDLIPDFDRDLYLLKTDVAAYDGSAEIYTYVSKIDYSTEALIKRDVLDLSATSAYSIMSGVVYENGAEKAETYSLLKTETEAADGNYVKLDGGTGYELYDSANATHVSKTRYNVEIKLVADDEGEFIKIHTGETTSVLKALADATLSTMDETIGNLTIGQVMEVYTEDVFEADESGEYVLIGGEYVKDDGTHSSELHYILAHEQSNGVLIELRDCKIIEMSSKINSISIEKLIPDFDRDVYVSLADLEAAALPNAVTSYVSNITDTNKPEARGTVEITSYDAATKTVTIDADIYNDYFKVNEVSAGEYKLVKCEIADAEYVLVHTGSTTKVLKALADSTLDTMNSDIASLTISDVIDLVDEDEYEIATAENSTGVSTFYKKITLSDGHHYVVWKSGDTEDKLVRTAEKSNAVLVAIADKQIDELGTAINEVIDDIMLCDVVELDPDIYVEMTETELAALKAGTLVETAYYNISGDGKGIFSAITRVGANDFEYSSQTNVTETDLDIAFNAHKLRVCHYEGTSQIIMKKMAYMKVSDLDNGLQTVIDDTSLNELIEINEKNVFEAGAGDYEKIKSGLTKAEIDCYYGTYEKMEYVDDKGTEDISDDETLYDIFVKVATGSGSYKLTTEASSAALRLMANVKIGKIGTEMQKSIDAVRIDGVMSIRGDVYKKLDATTADLAFIEINYAGYDSQVFVNDDDLMRPYDATDSEIVAAGEAKGYFARIHEGSDNAIVKKLATVTVQNMTSRINDAVNDSSLRELGIVTDSSTGILAEPEIADAKLNTLDDSVNMLLKNATIGDIINWCDIDGINSAVATALGEVSVVDFFEGLTIDDNGTPLDPSDDFIRFNP